LIKAITPKYIPIKGEGMNSKSSQDQHEVKQAAKFATWSSTTTQSANPSKASEVDIPMAMKPQQINVQITQQDESPPTNLIRQFFHSIFPVKSLCRREW